MGVQGKGAVAAETYLLGVREMRQVMVERVTMLKRFIVSIDISIWQSHHRETYQAKRLCRAD